MRCQWGGWDAQGRPVPCPSEAVLEVRRLGLRPRKVCPDCAREIDRCSAAPVVAVAVLP